MNTMVEEPPAFSEFLLSPIIDNAHLLIRVQSKQTNLVANHVIFFY